jgi:uncharacterized protein (DUF433 family)
MRLAECQKCGCVVESAGGHSAALCLVLAGEPSSGYTYRMIDWSSCPAVERDPERYSGAWLFRGTRVPVAALFENLEDDAPVHDFIEWFPGVTRDQVRAVLEHAARSALTAA